MVYGTQQARRQQTFVYPSRCSSARTMEQLSSSHKAPLRSLSLQTLTQRARHLRRWLYTYVPVTSCPENSETCFATVLTCTSLKPLSVFTPSPTKLAKRRNTKEDITGVHYIAALPCPPPPCLAPKPPPNPAPKSAIAYSVTFQITHINKN
jgi:hypothetical protein